MTLPLAGKRALVTGASGALGAAMARRLASMGAHVLLHGNSRPEAVQALADAITAAGGTIELAPKPYGDRRPPASGNHLMNR